ncbi:helix-turn-helix domain-containing protein [Mucilaginibacter sp. 22184]|uniref:AraC family transcriptional regulator n=1 Tax=Mucilaginibacter sp. 22184 TaxID=3453887 RepID=UPI003F82C303
MQSQLYDIAGELQPYLQRIGYTDLSGYQGLHPFIRFLPDTCVELFIKLGKNPVAIIKQNQEYLISDSFVTYRMNEVLDLQFLPEAACITIQFKPGAAHHFFKAPLEQFANHISQFQALWPNVQNDLFDQLDVLPFIDQKVNFIQEFLTIELRRHFKDNEDFQTAHAQIINQRGNVQIKSLAADVKISQRQLARNFHYFTGLSPKAYAKVSRFIACLAELKSSPGKSLTDITYEAGFYDQAHFINDCKNYTGYTPGELLGAKYVIY